MNRSIKKLFLELVVLPDIPLLILMTTLFENLLEFLYVFPPRWQHTSF